MRASYERCGRAVPSPALRAALSRRERVGVRGFGDCPGARLGFTFAQIVAKRRR